MVESHMGTGKGYLSDDEWRLITASVPISCVDILPARIDHWGRISAIGLIRRDSPWGEVWCHVGGRVLLDETLTEAASRHFLQTLSGAEADFLEGSPYLVNEFFRDARPGSGHDPRKHAIASCYLALVPAGIDLQAQGQEALEFRWWPLGGPLPDPVWPGTATMINCAEIQGGTSEGDFAAYNALSARHVSHDEMMWQTPGLAMAAMSFLLTIGLGEGNDLRRALAAALSVLVSLVSSQLLIKHSAMQIRDAEMLLDIERRLGMPRVHERPWNLPSRTVVAPGHNNGPRRPGRLQAWLGNRRSRVWWLRSLICFGVVSAAISVQALWHAFAAR